MAIKIIKKGAKTEAPDKLVDEALKARPAAEKVRTNADALKDWKDNGVAPGDKTKTVLCRYCEHWYIKPCDEARHSLCQNWLYLQSKQKAEAQG